MFSRVWFYGNSSLVMQVALFVVARGSDYILLVKLMIMNLIVITE